MVSWLLLKGGFGFGTEANDFSVASEQQGASATSC